MQVLAAPANRDSIVPYIKLFQTLIRRRPFLIKALENTLIKLIMSLEFFDDEGRQKIAIGVKHQPCSQPSYLSGPTAWAGPAWSKCCALGLQPCLSASSLVLAL